MDIFGFDNALVVLFYDMGCSVYDAAVSVATGFLTVSITENENFLTAWSYVCGLAGNSTIQAVAIELLAVFFLLSLIRRLTTDARSVNLEQISYMFLRLSIYTVLITNISAVMKSIFDAGAAIAKLFYVDGLNYGAGSSYEDFATETADLGLLNGVIMTIVALIFFIAMLECGLNFCKNVYMLYVDAMAIIPFAPLMLATGAGDEKVSQVSANYIKTIFGRVLMAALVITTLTVCAYGCGAIVDNLIDTMTDAMGVDSGSGFATSIFLMLKKYIEAHFINAAVSGIDRKVKSELGL